MRFRFSRILRKYELPYTLIRQVEGHYDSVGVYVPPQDIKLPLRGSVQPMGDSFLQEDGGKYDEDDRMLFSTFRHQNGDIIEYENRQYTIHMDDNWSAYDDVSEYKMKRVSTHDPV